MEALDSSKLSARRAADIGTPFVFAELAAAAKIQDAMKTSFCLLICFAVLAAAPIKSAELNPGAAKIENKLREIDLRLRLEQYEKIQKQLIEIRFQIALLSAEDMTDEERKKQAGHMSKMEDVLSVTLNQMLHQIRELAAKDLPGK